MLDIEIFSPRKYDFFIFFGNQIDQLIINCNVLFLGNMRQTTEYSSGNIHKISLFYIYTVARLLIDQCRFTKCGFRQTWVIKFAFPIVSTNKKAYKRSEKKRSKSLTLSKSNKVRFITFLCILFMRFLKKSRLKKRKVKSSLDRSRSRSCSIPFSKWSKVWNRLRVKDQSIHGWKPPTHGRTLCRAIESRCCAVHHCMIKVTHNFMDVKMLRL